MQASRPSTVDMRLACAAFVVDDDGRMASALLFGRAIMRVMPMRRPKPFKPAFTRHDRKVIMARRLRARATLAELALWDALKDCQTGYHFAFQVPLAGYIVDFYCRARHLAVEVDGGYHLTPAQAKADALREEHITRFDSRVRFLRFTNAQVLTALPVVLAALRRELGYP